jgi:hypothetical protein
VHQIWNIWDNNLYSKSKFRKWMSKSETDVYHRALQSSEQQKQFALFQYREFQDKEKQYCAGLLGFHSGQAEGEFLFTHHVEIRSTLPNADLMSSETPYRK